MNDADAGVTLEVKGGSVILRRAEIGDLTAILRLLADDPVSAARGDTGRPEDRPAYERAFVAIAADPAQQLLVAATGEGEVVGTMQLTVIPGLARVGASRLQIEAVRVRSDQRGRGIGGAMMTWAVGRATEVGARLVQLTSDTARVDAHRFYERLGFTASHVGFKYAVPAAVPASAPAAVPAAAEDARAGTPVEAGADAAIEGTQVSADVLDRVERRCVASPEV